MFRDPSGLFVGTLMRPILRIAGVAAQESALVAKAGDALTGLAISAGFIPSAEQIIPGASSKLKNSIAFVLASAEVWGGYQTLGIAYGLVLAGGSFAPAVGIVGAGIGGWFIGEGFTELWKAFSGQELGEDIYDWLHPTKPCSDQLLFTPF